MPWSSAQQSRLGVERGLLDNYFPNRVTWIDPSGGTKVEVRMTTSNDKSYTLRIYLPEDFPNSIPSLVIKNPSPTRSRSGNVLDKFTDTWHTYGTRDGYTQICHYRPEQWSSANTLYQVFIKGLIWLEAYEVHLRTGNPINTYLRDM